MPKYFLEITIEGPL